MFNRIRAIIITLFLFVSIPVMLGADDPNGQPEEYQAFGESPFSKVSAVDAPSGLVADYMDLHLRWKVPDSLINMNDMVQCMVDAIVDWKLNNGSWNDGMKAFTDKGDVSLIKRVTDMSLDKYGYASMPLDRNALGIPYNISLKKWLSNKTYYFRVRYVLHKPEENGVRDIASPFSNTVKLGMGTKAPAPPKLAAPTGLKATITNEGEASRVFFSWNIPESTAKVNKSFRVTTYVDCMPKGGKWITVREGISAAESTTGDLRDQTYVYLDSDMVKGVNSFRVFFSCEYKPDTYVYSGFSNTITIDSGKRKVTK